MAWSRTLLHKLPLTKEEWREVRRYRRVPLHRKLEMLDRMRSLMFEIWKSNPKIAKIQEKFRRGKI